MSSFISERFVLVPILVVGAMQLLFILSIASLSQTDALNQTNAYLHHTCINSQGTYRPGSPYEENVNRAIKTMFKKLLDYGFIHSVVGDAPNTVYPKLQCRGDLSLSQCHSCLTTAFAGIRKRCPKNKGRIIWYENCVLEISSVYRWSQIDYQNNFFLYNAKDASGDKESFNKKTKALLYNLKEKASSKENDPYGKNYMYATMEESLGTMKLYGMVQCMKDLSVKNCSLCLDWIMAKFPKCCNGKQGGRVLCTSCNFRYELYPFVKPCKDLKDYLMRAPYVYQIKYLGKYGKFLLLLKIP
ncbi:LOW QUALITY PROTEIN: putative cysteine-rich repeat secretory protein 21 [Eutrema salsugineum]|uniref:LOW QUALITY PROTEIN: putative cysteine-rich repeat secretory protein 21 n=1 Tax=Eutrema salsugineum TaxID=72664 RepID=UPI000CED223C|nr:LOW QUALITY PROTEIN: putative cysteine-rich repeat secretory protein 21 [Eutrema salsugineum]